MRATSSITSCGIVTSLRFVGTVTLTLDEPVPAPASGNAYIGLRIPGVRVEDVATTAKTLPDFTGMWGSMLAATARG